MLAFGPGRAVHPLSRCTRWATVRPPFLHSAGPLPPFLDGSSLVRDRRGAFLPGQAVHFRRTVPGLRRRPLTPVCQEALRWGSCKRPGKSAGKFPVGLCGRPGMRECLTDWKNSDELEGTAIRSVPFSVSGRSLVRIQWPRHARGRSSDDERSLVFLILFATRHPFLALCT
jgi:hypothetical protein